MNGVAIDKQVHFILQVGKTVMDSDKTVAGDIITVLREYGFKDAQIIGMVAMAGKSEDEPYTEITEEVLDVFRKEDVETEEEGKEELPR